MLLYKGTFYKTTAKKNSVSKRNMSYKVRGFSNSILICSTVCTTELYLIS